MKKHALVDISPTSQGLRDDRRRQTLQRIAEAGLTLFVEDGYEETTLDAIAEAAGISRRTFFHYFESKEDILLVWQDEFWDRLRENLLEMPAERSPFDVLSSLFLKHISRYSADQIALVDRVMCSTPALRARGYAAFERQEQSLVEAMSRVWTQPERQVSLRLIAMMTIGAVRLSIEDWNQDRRRKPIARHLTAIFAALADVSRHEISQR